MISIYNNFESVRLNRHISNRLGSLSKIFGRISTGLRINGANDDAAGLQIRDRITNQIISSQTEIKNITNESSLLQVAQGALSESQNALLRMREIAVSAGSQTLSFEDRLELENEFKALMGRINGIAQNTTFNDHKILAGDSYQLELSLLENQGTAQPLSNALLQADASHLGVQARFDSAQRGVFLSALESGDLNINGVSIRGTTRYDDQLSYCYASGSALAKAKVINSVSQTTGVRAIVDENVLTGQTALGALDLTSGRYFKLNGTLIAGLTSEAGDSTRTLRDTLNGLQSQTGVYATVDTSGRLVLNAQDGRNITLEYSDRQVREAIAILDSYGDPINVSDVVDPAEYTRNGDIVDVSYTGSASGFTATVMGSPTNPSDQSGSYSGTRDLVDFVLEVVTPGPIGVATYRVKTEDLTQVAQMTRDTNDEDYLFNADGAIIEPNPSKLFDDGTRYQEGSTRQVKVLVTEEGNLLASDPNDRPLADLILYNIDTGEDEMVVSNVRLEQGVRYEDFFADYGIAFEVNESTVSSYSNANGTVDATSPLALELTAGTGYSQTPEILEWTGTIKTDFNFLVTQTGHGLSIDDLGGTPPAELTVTASIYRDGSATPTETESINLVLSESSTADVTYDAINETYTLHFADPGAGDLTVRFPTPTNTVPTDGVTDPIWVVTSGYDLTPGFDNTYTGSDNLDYLIYFKSDGAFTGEVGDGPSADIVVNGVTVDSIGEVDDTYFDLLGPNGFEGLRLQMQAPIVDSQSSVTTYAGNDMTYAIGTYNEDNRQVVVEITKSGGTSGSVDQLAEFKYYYADDPGTILGTGSADFGAGVTLVNADGLIIQGDANTTNTLTNQTQVGTTKALRNVDVTGYTSELVGTMTAEVQGTSDYVYNIVSTGQVNDFSGVYTEGGAPSSFVSSVVLSGEVNVTVPTTFYLYFNGSYAWLAEGSDLDINSISEKRSNKFIDGSNNFNFGGGLKLDLNYDETDVDSSPSGDGYVTALKFEVNPPHQDLEINWTFEGGATASTLISNVQSLINQTVNLDFGVTAQLPSTAMDDGAVYTLEVTPENLQVGDKFFATLESQVSAGDSLSFTASPITPIVGSEWEVYATAPAWEQNEIQTITYQHNFESPLYTLTSTVSYPPGTQSESFGKLQISSTGDFQSGDEIRVKTRAFLGDVTSSGVYTESLYPTNYLLTVTQGGDISTVGGSDTVSISWARQDGLTSAFLDGGGTGSFNLTSGDLGNPISLEEGIALSFNDLGEGAYLATGDSIIIPVGYKLAYNFAAGISLQSEENITLNYSSTSIDSMMGRMFESSVNPDAPNESLTSGLLGKSNTRSLETVGILTRRQVNEAIETIDLAINQVNGSMAKVGAVMNRAVHRIESLNQQALDMMIARSRIEDADMAQETAKLASEQISIMSAPFLMEVSTSEAMTVLDLISQNTAPSQDIRPSVSRVMTLSK